MAEEGLLVQSKHLFEINIEPGADPGNFVRLAAGFNSFEVALNEELDQTPYLDGDGYATSTVMGAQLTITFTGTVNSATRLKTLFFLKQWRSAMSGRPNFGGPCPTARF